VMVTTLLCILLLDSKAGWEHFCGNKFKTDMDTPQTKRRTKAVDPSSDNDESTITMWPRCLVIQGTNKEFTLAKLNPFVIEKRLKGLAGTLAAVKKLISGDLIIELSKKSHTDCLLRSNMLINVPIKVVPQRSMNSKKGVILCRDLVDI